VILLTWSSALQRLPQSNPLTPASGAPTALPIGSIPKRSNGLIQKINHVKPTCPSLDDDSPE